MYDQQKYPHKEKQFCPESDLVSILTRMKFYDPQECSGVVGECGDLLDEEKVNGEGNSEQLQDGYQEERYVGVVVG